MIVGTVLTGMILDGIIEYAHKMANDINVCSVLIHYILLSSTY